MKLPALSCVELQGYLAHEKTPQPLDLRKTTGIVPL